MTLNIGLCRTRAQNERKICTYDNWESHYGQRHAWVCVVLIKDYHNNNREVRKQNRLLVESLMQAIEVWNYLNSLEHWALKKLTNCKTLECGTIGAVISAVTSCVTQSSKEACVGWLNRSILFASFLRRSSTRPHVFIVTHSLTCHVCPNFKCHIFRVGVTKDQKTGKVE